MEIRLRPSGAVTLPGSGLGPDFTGAVNLSTHSLLDDCFATEVSVALDRAGIPPARLVLEITETTLMADPERAKDLPMHDLEIDRSFVAEMDEGSDDTVIVRSVIDLGQTLGLRTIAEGAENLEILGRLADLGCDSAQGYAVARPAHDGRRARVVDAHPQRPERRGRLIRAAPGA